jgi:hypothetical protein
MMSNSAEATASRHAQRRKARRTHFIAAVQLVLAGLAIPMGVGALAVPGLILAAFAEYQTLVGGDQ